VSPMRKNYYTLLVLSLSLLICMMALIWSVLSIVVGHEAASLPTYVAFTFTGVLGISIGIALSDLNSRIEQLEKLARKPELTVKEGE